MRRYFERRYQELQSWIEGPFCGWSIWSNLYQLSDKVSPGGLLSLIWKWGELIFLHILQLKEKRIMPICFVLGVMHY